MTVKKTLSRGGLILLAALLATGCDKGGADAKKDDAKAEKDDDKSDDGDADEKDDKETKGAKADDEKKGEASDGSVFTARDVTVGDKRSEVFTQAMEMDIEAMGKKKSMKSGKTRERTEEVLAVADGSPSKLKVTFEKSNETKMEGGPPTTEAEPIEGKTYIVENKDGTVEVTTEDGGKPPANEVAAVTDVYEKKFKRKGAAEFKKALMAAKLEEGKRATDLENAFKDYFLQSAGGGLGEKAAGPELAELKIIYQGTEGDNALFDIDFGMNLDQPGMKMKMPLKGKLKVLRKGAQIAGMEVSGPIEIDTTGTGLPIKGSGKMSIKSDVTYELK